MKTIRKTALFCAAALLLAACSASDEAAPVREGEVVYPTLQIGVAEMTFSADTRAAQPMNPDTEKYVRTIAIFEFDKEGLHTNSSSTYHFLDFINGTVDGSVPEEGKTEVHATEFGIVETVLTGLSFESHEEGTLCLVANITEDMVADFYETYREPGQSDGRITFEQFKRWALPFKYEELGDKYDETKSGHLTDMYMFGYYQGKIDATTPGAIPVDLGRLASRLDISVVNETGREIKKRLGYHFDNVCTQAFFFPGKSSMPPTYGASRSRTVICSGLNDDGSVNDERLEDAVTPPAETFPDKGVHTHYFYVAAHAASTVAEATKLHLFYNNLIVDDEFATGEGISIPLCNVHPDQAAEVHNGYSLSRNTRYHFTIRLKGANTQTASVRSEITRPGEITVYLPLDD